MGYKQKAKKAYEDCQPLIEELHQLIEWFEVENAKWKEHKKKTRIIKKEEGKKKI